MRAALIVVVMEAAVMPRLCQKQTGDDASELPPAASAVSIDSAHAKQAAAPELSRSGGHALHVGEYVIEVLPYARGHVIATVRGSDGNLVRGDVKLGVKLQGIGGRSHDVAMVSSERAGAFVGETREGAPLTSGSLEVRLRTGDTERVARLARVAVADEPCHGGTLILLSDVASEVSVLSNGQVHVYLSDVPGAGLRRAARATVTAVLARSDGSTHRIPVSFEPSQQRYVGSLEGPADKALGFVLQIVDDGQTKVGRHTDVTVLPPATLGGRVMLAGRHPIELLVDGDGVTVAARVMDANGAVQSAEAVSNLQLSEDGSDPVRLHWDASAGLFRGKAERPVALDKSLDVELLSSGERQVGHLCAYRASGSLAELTNGDAVRGAKALKRYNCGSCHVIPGIGGATSTVGPTLDLLSRRPFLAGRVLNTPENMVRWIRNPREIEPESVMPDVGVTDQEARDMAAYLYGVPR